MQDDLQTPPEAPETAEAREEFVVPLIFRDGLDQPIADLKVFVGLPRGEFSGVTTAQGVVTITFDVGATGTAPIDVLDLTSQRQRVCEIDLARCTHAVVIHSPKVVVDMPLRPHQQTPPTAAAPAPKPAPRPAAAQPTPQHVDLASPWWQANGAAAKAIEHFASLLAANTLQPGLHPAAQHGLTPSGNPVTLLAAPECPNKDNLVLGRNNVYREAILGAAKRLGLIPQAICALVDCEAAKVAEHIPLLDKKGKPLLDKKGKPRTRTIHEVWKADSYNAKSGAGGMTQFLASTWLGHVLIPGRYIHDQSKAAGWVRSEAVPKKGQRWVFVLADGKTTTAPNSHHSDAHVKACLAMRMDPTWAINAAADYGNANLQLLKTQGFKIDGLADMDKAKLMYLMHHEGEGAGPDFINDTLAPTDKKKATLKKKFVMQIGNDKVATAMDNAGDDVEVAYRNWLADFIDGVFFSSSRFFCSNPVEPSSLTKLLERIGGVKVKKVAR